MNKHIYHESYLPVRFFLNQVVVHCPSCNEKAMITSDLPPVASQEKINLIFNDAGTFTSCHYYQWKKARFLCPFCQKHMETNRDNQLKTWHSSVICYAQTICINCKSEGTKKKLFLNREYKSLQLAPDKIEIICDRCKTGTITSWVAYPAYSAVFPIDPIFGLKLFAVTQFKNEMLWVYNLEHLLHIKAYIQAKQRKKAFKIDYSSKSTHIGSRKDAISFSDQIPRIFKSEMNRNEVLKLLDKLKIAICC